MTVPFNPYGTSNAGGYFGVTSEGFVQGMFMDDPAIRYQLRAGPVALTETLPMFGGVGVFVNIPNAGTNGSGDVLGPMIGRATSLTGAAQGNLQGFSVFNQANAGIASAQSPVPQVPPGVSMSFFLLGSNAQIVVGVNPALVNIDTLTIDTHVSWDFTNQQLVAGVAAYPADAITAASWANTNGGQVTYTTTTAHGVAVGDNFTISGMTPAGYNGDFVAITGTTGSTLVAALTTNPGAETGLGTLVAGGGYLPVKVLSVNPNGKVWTYNATTGACTWSTGYTALIKI
jgi:hypothetical protein